MNLSDFGKEARSVVATVAPTLGMAFGGPLGGAAGTWLANKFGNGDSKQAAAVIAAGDPQTLLELQKLGVEFKAHTAELGLNEEQLQAQNTQDARALAIRTGNVWIPATLAIVFLLGWAVIQATLLYHVVPEINRDLISRTLGTLDIAIGTILGYYFGSSLGSSAKNSILQQMADKAT